MYLLNKFRNFININPITRRLFVRLVSPLTVPFLILKKYLSISEYKNRKKIKRKIVTPIPH